MVSIIIPLYNSEKTIRRAILSALSQKYKDIEVIVINDCSTDNSLDICNEYADKITIITTDKNSGVPYLTRQIGLAHAKGDFITFLDADDYLSSNAISNCLKLQEQTKADIVQMKITRRFTNRNIPICFKSNYDTTKAMEACLYDEKFFPVQCWGKLYKIELLQSIAPIRYNGFWGEDRIFNMPIFAKASNIQYAPSAHYNYSWGGATTSTFNINALQDYKQIYQIKRDWANENCYGHYNLSMQKELVDLLKYHIRHLINSGSMTNYSAQVYLRTELAQSFWNEFQLPTAEELYQIEKKSVCRIVKKVITNFIS